MDGAQFFAQKGRTGRGNRGASRRLGCAKRTLADVGFGAGKERSRTESIKISSINNLALVIFQLLMPLVYGIGRVFRPICYFADNL